MRDPTWNYGIITVPQRLNDTFPYTLRSLRLAGFDKPRIFLDGKYKHGFTDEYIYLMAKSRIPITVRDRIGHLGNWMLGLLELYASNPLADKYALFEDDLICCQHLKKYLDSCEYPQKGYWNLITQPTNINPNYGPAHGWQRSNQYGRGAVGLVFDLATVRELLTSGEFVRRVTSHKQGADGMVMDALKKKGFTEYIHYPGLIQHQESESTLGHKYGAVGVFRGEDYDPMVLLNGSCSTPPSI